MIGYDLRTRAASACGAGTHLPRTAPRICCALKPQPPCPNVPSYELSIAPFLSSHCDREQTATHRN